MSSFKRPSGFFGGSIQEFIDELAPSCPFCGTVQPEWSSKLKKNLFHVNQILFKCSCCDSILAAPASDVCGMGSIPITTSGYVKNQSWHYASVMNIEIISLGTSGCQKFSEGEICSPEEIRKITVPNSEDETK